MKKVSKIFVFIIIFLSMLLANAQIDNSSSKIDTTKPVLSNLSDSIEHFLQLSNSHLDSSIYFENLDSSKNAFIHYHYYLSNLEYNRRLLEKKKKLEAYEFYNIEKAEKENLIFQKEKEILKYQTNRNNIIIYALIGLFIILVLILFLILQINRIKSNRKLIEISERNLRQQLNPEFTLNTLNSIQYSIFTDNKNKSHENLSRFAKFMRLVLENSQHKLISLHKEIETINYYLELESFRLKDRFNFHLEFNTDVDTFETKIPPLLIQSLIEILLNELNSLDESQISLQIKFDNHSKKLRTRIYYSYSENSIINNITNELKKSKLYNDKIDLIKTVYKNVNIQNTNLIEGNNSKAKYKLEVSIPLIY